MFSDITARLRVVNSLFSDNPEQMFGNIEVQSPFTSFLFYNHWTLSGLVFELLIAHSSC